MTMYSGGAFSSIGSPSLSSQACPLTLPSASFRTPNRIRVAKPFRDRYRRNTAARFQHIGLQKRISADRSKSMERASRFGSSTSWVSSSSDSRPDTNSSARGNEHHLAAADKKPTHHAMRQRRNASRGCDTHLRPATNSKRIGFFKSLTTSCPGF